MGKILRSKPIDRVCKDQVFTKMMTTDLDIDTLANKGKIIIYPGILQIYSELIAALFSPRHIADEMVG